MRLEETRLNRLGNMPRSAAQTLGRKKLVNRVMAGVLAVSMVVTAALTDVGIVSWAAEDKTGPTADVAERNADKDTMSGYQTLVAAPADNEKNGLVWTDKTVIAYKSGASNEVNIDGNPVSYNEDFLEVFSALGSSQTLNSDIPMDVVFVLDVSSSMNFDNSGTKASTTANTRIYRTVSAINSAIDYLMDKDTADPAMKNRVGLRYSRRCFAFGDVYGERNGSVYKNDNSH